MKSKALTIIAVCLVATAGGISLIAPSIKRTTSSQLTLEQTLAREMAQLLPYWRYVRHDFDEDKTIVTLVARHDLGAVAGIIEGRKVFRRTYRSGEKITIILDTTGLPLDRLPSDGPIPFGARIIGSLQNV